MGLEKNFQSEVSRTFKALGWAKRLQQDTIICLHCHRPVHPINAGFPDIHAELDATPYNIPAKIEAKAGEDRFSFDDISLKQRHFLGKYIAHGGIAYIWLQLGSNNVNAIHLDGRRRVWIIPYGYFLASLIIMRKAYGLKYIPLQLVPRMHLKDKTMTVLYLYDLYEAEWIAGPKIWRPNKLHPIWELRGLKTSYETFGDRLAK